MQIDGFGSAKINAAHVYGNQYDYPGNGPKLLADTLTQYLGVPIHYYVRGDFSAFREAVDQVGGVDINVKTAITDPTFPTDDGRGITTYHINAGPHHLNGEQALQFVRSRHTTSDFDRAARQQQLMLAIKDKVLSFATLLNPLKINSLLKTAGDHIRTDIGINEGRKLLDIASQVPAANVSRAALSTDVGNYLTGEILNGQDVLVPINNDWAPVRLFARSLMIDSYIRRERPTVQILNGTANSGLALQTADLLKSFGYNVVKATNAANTGFQHSQLLAANPGAKPYTTHYLEKRFGTSVQTSDKYPDVDFTVILGSDYTPTN